MPEQERPRAGRTWLACLERGEGKEGEGKEGEREREREREKKSDTIPMVISEISQFKFFELSNFWKQVQLKVVVG